MKKYITPILAAILFFTLMFLPAPAQTVHSVTLTWNASPTTGVLYIVSRGTVSGGPYTALASTVSVLTYTDTTGTGGTTYYYVVQATCAGGSCPAGITGTREEIRCFRSLQKKAASG